MFYRIVITCMFFPLSFIHMQPSNYFFSRLESFLISVSAYFSFNVPPLTPHFDSPPPLRNILPICNKTHLCVLPPFFVRNKFKKEYLERNLILISKFLHLAWIPELWPQFIMHGDSPELWEKFRRPEMATLETPTRKGHAWNISGNKRMRLFLHFL